MIVPEPDDSEMVDAVKRLFSSRRWRTVLQGAGSIELDQALRLAAEKMSLDGPATRLHVLQTSFEWLSRNRRTDYYFRERVTNQLRRSRTDGRSVILNEVYMGRNVADVLYAGYPLQIFEIKSSFDSLARLEQQLVAYFRVAPLVTVVADHSSAGRLLDQALGSPVGLRCVGPRGGLEMVKKPKPTYDYIDSMILLSVLRDAERVQMLQDVNPVLGQAPNGERFAIAMAAAEGLDRVDLVSRASAQLRQRPSLAVPDGLDCLSPVLAVLRPANADLVTLNLWLEGELS